MDRREFLKILGVTSAASVTSIKIALPKEKKRLARVRPKKGECALLLSSEGSEIGWSSTFILHMVSPPLPTFTNSIESFQREIERTPNWLIEFEELDFVTDLARKYFQQSHMSRSEIDVSVLLKNNLFYSGSVLIKKMNFTPPESFINGTLVGQSKLVLSRIK